MVLAHRPGQKRRYAETLLKTQLGAVAAPLGCHWLAGAAPHPLEQRIAALRRPAPDFQRQDMGAAVAALVIAIAAYGALARPAVRHRRGPAAGLYCALARRIHHMQAIIVSPVHTPPPLRL